MKVYPPRDIRPFVMYCVNGKPRSSLLIESTDSMITFGLKRALHALGEQTGRKTELYQTNIKGQGFIYAASFQHKLH